MGWRDHAHAAGALDPAAEASALSILLPPRSLLFFTEDAYTRHLHGITARSNDVLDESVANWTTERRERWSRTAVPDWAKQQITGCQWNPMDAAMSTGCMSRAERYSLTLRHVPVLPSD